MKPDDFESLVFSKKEGGNSLLIVSPLSVQFVRPA